MELIEFLSVDCTAADGVWHSDSEIKIDKNGYVIRSGEKLKSFGTDASVAKKAAPPENPQHLWRRNGVEDKLKKII